MSKCDKPQLTRGGDELERLERDNRLQALEAANWRIKGSGGAAELLGVKPTTLLSRMNKWGLKEELRNDDALSSLRAQDLLEELN